MSLPLEAVGEAETSGEMLAWLIGGACFETSSCKWSLHRLQIAKSRKLDEINITQFQLINWLNEFSF